MAMYASLGDIVFEVAGPVVALQAERRYGYARHELALDRPRLQPVGDDLERLTLTLVFTAALEAPELALRRLQALAAAKAPAAYVLGTGEVRGRYVVETLALEAEETDAVGQYTHLRVRVELVEWVDDRPLVAAPARPDRRPTDAARRATTPAAAAPAAVVRQRPTPPAQPAPAANWREVPPAVITRARVAVPAAGPAAVAVGTRVVEAITRDGVRWDTLAAELLGDPLLWPVLARANPHLPLTPTLARGLAVVAPVLEAAGRAGVGASRAGADPTTAALDAARAAVAARAASAVGLPPWRQPA